MIKPAKKLTILIGTESYYPTISGVAVFSRLLALGMIKRGHTVHVICPATRLESYQETDAGIHVHRVRAIKNPFRPKLKVSLFPRRDVAKWFMTIKPDVVHMQDPTSICSELIRMCKKTQTPSIITNHFSFDYVLSYLPWLKFCHGLIAKMLERYLVKMYNSCGFVTFPSETIRNEFGHHKLKVASEAISNGVNLDQFLPSYNFDEMKQHYRIPNVPIILHVGRLDRDKRSHLVLESFILLRKTHTAHLIICGEGTMKEALRKTARAAGLESDVTFIGFINHQTELPQIYQMATVFTTASTIETQGIVALEAMASGLPLVVPNAGALPELVKDKVNGYLFAPNHVIAMSQKLVDILDNPDEARRMGDKSLEMVEQHEVSHSMNKFEQIYHNLVQ